jgi:addiction module RelE/StbE family toxin
LTTLIYSRHAVKDLERLALFLEQQHPHLLEAVIDLIVEAVEVLARHPRIGRPVEQALRELVISRGKTGYVALYDYDEHEDLVVVLAIRHQREAGYPDD